MRGKLAVAAGCGALLLGTSLLFSGCGDSGKTSDGKTRIEMVQYKPEAVKAFEALEQKFNETHDDIELTIESPNEAMTILKTRFIKEDQPDIIGIGGDINYSNFLDSDMLQDISDFDGLADIKQAYLGGGRPLQQGDVRGKRVGDPEDLDGIYRAPGYDTGIRPEAPVLRV